MKDIFRKLYNLFKVSAENRLTYENGGPDIPDPVPIEGEPDLSEGDDLLAGLGETPEEQEARLSRNKAEAEAEAKQFTDAAGADMIALGKPIIGNKDMIELGQPVIGNKLEKSNDATAEATTDTADTTDATVASRNRPPRPSER